MVTGSTIMPPVENLTYPPRTFTQSPYKSMKCRQILHDKEPAHSDFDFSGLSAGMKLKKIDLLSGNIDVCM
eukprot:766477-Hanusia_phi.AAC.5